VCEAVLIATATPEFWEHPSSAICQVKLTDALGLCVDDDFILADDRSIRPIDAKSENDVVQDGDIAGFVPGEAVVQLASGFVAAEGIIDFLFQNAGLVKLGGASGDRGWSSVSTFQRCPYLWKRRYIDKVQRGALPNSPGPTALEVGSITHVLLAIYYQRIIEGDSYPITPQQMRDGLLAGNVTPDHVNESWRLFEAYTAYYAVDEFEPLAVEHHLVDPTTNRSCRLDLVMWKDKPSPGFPPGTYIFDHKTASRFDGATLSKWRNDGELIGQWDIYKTLRLDKRFGALVGLVANMIGRQKDPRFERVVIHPSDSLLRDHRVSLKVWSAQIDLAKANKAFPRARAGCVAQHGLCDQFEHCTQEYTQ
jgi:hypothetical protein